MKKKKVLVIVGPTSAGKSALAVEIARRFNGEVISADSRQVYKGLNIDTGKITKREMKGVRHHLLDIVSPKKIFTAHDFVVEGRKKILSMIYHRKLPIIAGGTGLYIDALLGRVALPDVSPNQKLRAVLKEKTSAQLFALLKRKDPRRAAAIEPHNKRRLIRALEIVDAHGAVPRKESSMIYHRILWIGLIVPQRRLEQKIRARLKLRIKRGMIAEAKRLHKAGLSYRRMAQLGLEYRALAHFLQGKISREEMIESLYRDIRRYAKKQLGYWRCNKKIVWIDPRDKTSIALHVKKFIEQP